VSKVVPIRGKNKELRWVENSYSFMTCPISDPECMFQTDILCTSKTYGENDEEIVVGRSHFIKVATEEALEYGVPFFDLLDFDSRVYHLSSIYDIEGKTFSDEADAVLLGETTRDVFIIDRLEVPKAYRGHGLGKLIIEDAIKHLCPLGGAIALKCFPLQLEENAGGEVDNEWDSSLCLEEFSDDEVTSKKKLAAFYKSIGFSCMKDTDIMLRVNL